MAPHLLEVEGLGKRFGGFVALDGIDLAVRPGERVGLIGPNGSGKSTFVNCLCGVVRHETGAVRFAGRDLAGVSAHERTRLGICRSFQLPRPFWSLTVAENIRVPLLYSVNARKGQRLSERQMQTACAEILARMGLQDDAKRYPRELTQVEMRKLELARALAAGPKLLIADEPMAGLSHSELGEVVDLLGSVSESGVTVILIEHIMTAVMRFAQRLVVFVSGRLIADGLPAEVVRNPQVEVAYLGQ